MNPYEKIETLYDRNPDDMKHVIMGQIRLPEFELVRSWHITEKIDGKNVRVIYVAPGAARTDSEQKAISPNGVVMFGGRSDNAHFSEAEQTWLELAFKPEDFALAFPDADSVVTLYGEFYGPKIQSGGWYRDSYNFRIFDVKVGQWWLNWGNVMDVSRKLGVETVPMLDSAAPLKTALSLVEFNSEVANIENYTERLHEGIIARTDPLLFMRDGRRLMWKLKVSDLP